MIRSTLNGLARPDCNARRSRTQEIRGLVEAHRVLDPLAQRGDHLNGAAGAGVEDHEGQAGGVEGDATEFSLGDQRVVLAGVQRWGRSRERSLAYLVDGEAVRIVHAPES